MNVNMYKVGKIDFALLLNQVSHVSVKLHLKYVS